VIIAIGIDLIEVGRVRQILERTPRFITKVFTEQERAYCESKGARAAASFAARFAAKEAALKALGTGWSGGITWHDVEVVTSESGAPSLILTGKAKEIFDSMNANAIHVSLSHTNEYAIAQVLIAEARAK
jgi:holo-[acyl-carrier protein] synthase